MNGKLSWMIVAVIGGVIVTVGIFVFFGFFSSNLLGIAITSPAAKAWAQFLSGMNKAFSTGGAILPGWKLDWGQCYSISYGAFTDRWQASACDKSHFCNWGGCSGTSIYDQWSNDRYKVDYNSGNVIFILNKSDVSWVKGKVSDYNSRNNLERCKTDYCSCLGYAKYGDTGDLPYSNLRGDICYFGPASFITSDSFLQFESHISSLKILGCSPIKSKVIVDDKELKAIQHFEGILYLNRVKDSNGNYVIKLSFSGCGVVK